ncbi:MAG: hypothetical protein ACRC9R_00605, partial [Enterovibrio sp.]
SRQHKASINSSTSNCRASAAELNATSSTPPPLTPNSHQRSSIGSQSSSRRTSAAGLTPTIGPSFTPCFSFDPKDKKKNSSIPLLPPPPADGRHRAPMSNSSLSSCRSSITGSNSNSSLNFLPNPFTKDVTNTQSHSSGYDVVDFQLANPFLNHPPPRPSSFGVDFELKELIEMQKRLFDEKGHLAGSSELQPDFFQPQAVQCGEFVLCRLAEMSNLGDPNFANDPTYPKVFPFLFTDYSYAVGCRLNIPYRSFSNQVEAFDFLKNQNKTARFIVTTYAYGGHHFIVHHDGDNWVIEDQIGGRQHLDDKKLKFIKRNHQESAWYQVNDRRTVLALIALQKIQKFMGEEKSDQWSNELCKYLEELDEAADESRV